MMKNVKEVVDRFFEKYKRYFEQEHDLTLEKECYEDWNEDWAIFFAFPPSFKCKHEWGYVDEHDVAELLKKEFEGDETVKIVVHEETHEIEVYRDSKEVEG